MFMIKGCAKKYVVMFTILTKSNTKTVQNRKEAELKYYKYVCKMERDAVCFFGCLSTPYQLLWLSQEGVNDDVTRI
jgi:hypothetical protein